ncbi:hypothetical protein ACNS7O_12195 [Haloferacaceae archaeon DSL9]
MPSRRGFDLDPSERLRYRGALRPGGEVGVTDRRIVFVDGETTSVPYENVDEISHESFDWYLGVLSLALVGFGLYSFVDNPLPAGGFVLAGVWSLRRTYRRRDRVRIHTHSRPKPVTVFPADVEALYGALEPALDSVRESADPRRGSGPRDGSV